MESLKKLKNLDKKTKISISVLVMLLIVAIVCAVIVLVKYINETKEVALNEEPFISVEDVTEENIQFEYNTEPTLDPINVSVTNYNNDYNLYYYIQQLDGLATDEEQATIDESQEQLETENITVTDEQTEEQYSLYTEPIFIEANSNIYFKYEKDGQYSKNAYKLEISNITLGEGATAEELAEEQVDPNDQSNNTSNYYIKVNYKANTVTIYKKDSNNEYTIPVKAMVCSTGTATPTSGVYKTTSKYVWKLLNGGVYGQYATRIVGSILFHSVPYASPNHNALKYVAYDKLGTKASAGCIRLTVADAKWIYDNCGSGTMVEFYASSNPGPLGKPSARKISSVVECRNYDPTDPVAGNPWATYTGQTSQTIQESNDATTSVPTPQPSNPTPQEPQTPETPTGNPDLANTKYYKTDTTTRDKVISILKEEIQKDEQLTGATVSVGSKEKAQSAGVSSFEYSKEAVISKLSAVANYYVYVETEYTYDSTGTSASPTKTCVYIYID